MIWGMAYQGVKEKPILGWGQDNYSYVFAKYYDPAMYNQEQWFDRTHDVFYDWLIAAGFLGLIAYLVLFLSAIYTLWRKTDDNWSVTERAVLTGMLVAYFVHNIFVFDNLASYIFFFTILAFINTRGQGGRTLTHKPLVADDYVLIVDIVAVIVLVYVMWISVLSPYNSSGNLIKAMQDKQRVLVDNKEQIVSTDAKVRFKLIKSVLDANDLTRSESRERLVDVATSIIIQSNKTDPALAKEVYDYTLDQYAKETAGSKGDPRPWYFESIFYQKLGMNDKALIAIQQASKLSPTKQSFLFSEGQILLSLKKTDEALVVFKKAYELDKTNPEALKYYSFSLIENGKINEIDPLLVDHVKYEPAFKAESVWNDPVVLQALMDAKIFDKAITIAKKKVDDNPKDIQSLVSLSAVYLKSGDKWAAIETLKKIKAIEPGYSAEVDKYVKDIEDGKDPSAQNATNAN